MESPDKDSKTPPATKTENESLSQRKSSDRSTNDPLNRSRKSSLRKHENAFIRFFANVGFKIWFIVMAVGIALAFVVAIMAI